MATISLEYDGKNIIAQKAMDFILSLGVFHRVDTLNSAEKKTLKAIQEIENGKGTVCNTYEEYLEAIK